MGGENWETRWVRSRAGLLRSPRDLHFVFATFGARQSLRNLVPLLALLGTALATLGRSRALLAGYVQALQVRYQGAPKAVWNYVEIVGLQKLLGLSASLVAIGANPLDFLPTASPSSHHPHRPPGSGQFMGSFSPNVFLFTGHFFPENVFRPSTDPPLNVNCKFLFTFTLALRGGSVDGRSGKKCPVKRNTFGGKETIPLPGGRCGW